MNKLLSLLTFRKLIHYRCLGSKLTSDGKEIPKAIKRETIQNRITLIGNDNSVSITDLVNAQNLSDKRGLKLVKVQDINAKTKRPVYKLITKAEYYDEEIMKRKEKQNEKNNNIPKGKKLITLSSKIGHHDLMVSIRKMLKLLEKRYEVKVIISGGSDENMQMSERIFLVIDSNIKPAGIIVQKTSKGNSIRFQLMQSREISENSLQNSNQEKQIESNDSGPL